MQLASYKFLALPQTAPRVMQNKAQIRNDRNDRHDCQVGDIEHEILLNKQRDIEAE